MNPDILNAVMPYAVGPMIGTAAVLLFLGIRYAVGLPADARKREVAVIGSLIASAVLGAYELGQRSWGALLGAAGQAALVALLARIGKVEAPTRTLKPKDPPRTEDDDDTPLLDRGEWRRMKGTGAEPLLLSARVASRIYKRNPGAFGRAGRGGKRALFAGRILASIRKAAAP